LGQRPLDGIFVPDQTAALMVGGKVRSTMARNRGEVVIHPAPS